MEYVPEDEIIAQWIEVLGPMPKDWSGRWEKRSEWFDDKGRPPRGRWVWPPMQQAFEDCIQEPRRKLGMGGYSSEETTAILDLMSRMLAFCPEERPSVDEVLESEWMVKWVMPDYHRSRQMEQ
jgi:serine/threonine protein kinase